MKKYGKVIGFIFLLLFFCRYSPSLQSTALADDFSSPGPQWQAIPAYGPELAILADWQDTTSTDNTTDFGALLGTPTENATNDMDHMPGTTLTSNSATGDMGNMLSGLMGSGGMGGLGGLLGGLMGGNNGNLLGTSTIPTNTNSTSSGADSTQCPEDEDLGFGGVSVTADLDPSKPGRETKYFSPLVIDTDRNGVIALDGGTIPFDIAPHLAGLETIPVPAVDKDMFLVWDKAGTESIEGTERNYKDGEIVDITELFGPTDYTRSDFSNLAYTDDGFTKLRKLCDVNNDGDVDKQDTALSAEVSAKLKLWSPLSGQLILFKDTDIVVDVRSGSYERHPSDVQGWAVEYKMKDNQDRLVGYQWLTSKTSSPLCVDVLLAIQ